MIPKSGYRFSEKIMSKHNCGNIRFYGANSAHRLLACLGDAAGDAGIRANDLQRFPAAAAGRRAERAAVAAALLPRP